jgi:hypothetical protein
MRKTSIVTIEAEGRDKGKMFLLTEMGAVQAEKWALRLFFALMNTGVEIPPDIAELGMAGIASMGLQALSKLPYDAAEPLLDDMWACAQIIPDPSKKNVARFLMDDDIEEIGTRIFLRKEIFDLHTGFFTSAASSTSAPEAAAHR